MFAQPDDPIEVFGFSKFTKAFLDLNLIIQKGGIEKDLLCKHLFSFVQENGVEAMKNWPRFKPTYLSEITSKLAEVRENLRRTMEETPSLDIENINKKNHKQTKARKMTEKKLSAKRKTFAYELLGFIENSLSIRGSIETGRFTEESESFELQIYNLKKHASVEQFLKEKKLSYDYNEGYFEIFYPAELTKNGIDGKKTLINLTRRERERVARVLASKGLYQKKGGRGKKNPGSFTFNRSETITREFCLRISLIDKKMDTLKSIYSAVRNYYDTKENKGLVEVIQDKENYIVEVKYEKEFFFIPETEKISTQETIPVITQEEKIVTQAASPDLEEAEGSLTKYDESGLVFELGVEQALNAHKQIRKMLEQLATTEKDIIVHSWHTFFAAFEKVLKENNIFFFEVSATKDGDETTSSFSGISFRKLRELAELAVISEIELKPKN